MINAPGAGHPMIAFAIRRSVTWLLCNPAEDLQTNLDTLISELQACRTPQQATQTLMETLYNRASSQNPALRPAASEISLSE